MNRVVTAGVFHFCIFCSGPVWFIAETPGLSPYAMVVTAALIVRKNIISDVLVARQF